MPLGIKAMAMAIGILWGGCILFVGAVNLVWPSYGLAFLQLCASVYPGYNPGTGIVSVVIGAVYGLADGALVGACFAWLYNVFVLR